MTAKKTSALHVVENDGPVDLNKMDQELRDAIEHLRPAITRASVDREHLETRLAERLAERATLIEKKTLAGDLYAAFCAAINDEVSDLDAAISLFSGVSGRQPMASDD